APPEEGGASSPREGSGRVLLIDDEPLVRAALRAVLETVGYEVREAADGAEGLAIFEAEGESLSAVILDRSMPRISGEQVLAQLRVRAPGLPVVLLSGDPGATSASLEASAVLMKPTPTRVLLETLHRVIEARRR